jgi:hypothetical protein
MIQNLPAFITCAVFYAICGTATVGYLWRCRTPIAASVRRLAVPKIDKDAEWSLSDGGDVGVV